MFRQTAQPCASVGRKVAATAVARSAIWLEIAQHPMRVVLQPLEDAEDTEEAFMVFRTIAQPHATSVVDQITTLVIVRRKL